MGFTSVHTLNLVSYIRLVMVVTSNYTFVIILFQCILVHCNKMYTISKQIFNIFFETRHQVIIAVLSQFWETDLTEI